MPIFRTGVENCVSYEVLWNFSQLFSSMWWRRLWWRLFHGLYGPFWWRFLSREASVSQIVLEAIPIFTFETQLTVIFYRLTKACTPPVIWNDQVIISCTLTSFMALLDVAVSLQASYLEIGRRLCSFLAFPSQFQYVLLSETSWIPLFEIKSSLEVLVAFESHNPVLLDAFASVFGI